MDHGEDDEPFGDALPADEGDGHVEDNHAQRRGEADSEQLGDAVDKDREAGEAARKEVRGVDEGLDDKCLQQGRAEHAAQGYDTADDRIAPEALDARRVAIVPIGDIVTPLFHGRLVARYAG